MNPASGGTPARASIKTNIAVPISGSLRASPDNADNRLAPPSISSRPRTRNAPNLNATNPKRMLAYSSVAHAGYMLAAMTAVGAWKWGEVDAPADYADAIVAAVLGIFGQFIVPI